MAHDVRYITSTYCQRGSDMSVTEAFHLFSVISMCSVVFSVYTTRTFA